ncbi:MAG: serine hydrolase [Saprospiraceae bacterium]|jgi:cell division protein FtsI/penicillin-binding protein 2|nr:serine hydrolase [Saprospiraceae bacterium]
MNFKNQFFILGLLGTILLASCAGNKNIITSKFLKDPVLKSIADNPEHEVQIIFTRVNKKEKTFTSFSHNVMPDKYFYPASTVKMPIAILALQKLNEIKKSGVDISRKDNMLTAAFRPNQTPAFVDTTTTNNQPNIERYIQRIFAVSDNNAYNRLYEFLGQDYINETLKAKGVFTNSVINCRLSVPGLTPEDNRYTNDIKFFKNSGTLYNNPGVYAKKEWKHNAIDAVKGVGYIDDKGVLINQPFDFTMKNFYSLKDMEGTLQRIIFPEFFPENQRFDLTSDDYEFLKKTMSDLPKTYPFYSHDTTYYDSYVKYFMFGDSKAPMPDDIKIYNKVGLAYGYLIDCAYIESKSKDVGFFLTAVINVNKNKIYNDETYEYNEIGLPFLAKLGRVVYENEIKGK